MVGKKVITRLMEEFLGEYIINISQENLSVAVLRGKLKLENVQLDGDLIGSHVLSAVGLSGFAVLSCTAEKLRANIPWGRLEKEPTTFEISGVQLICVPLLPSNATRVFGSGTKLDPKCTLRTRVKRSALARYERNFFSWRIPGEGPKRPNQPKKKKTKRKRRRRDGGGSSTVAGGDSVNTSVWDEQSTLGPASDFSPNEGEETSDEPDDKDLTDAQRNAWRAKLRIKIFRNMELTIRDVHVRCEVREGSLHEGTRMWNNFGSPSPSPSPSTQENHFDADKRAFAFGVQVDSLAMKSANSNWETGKNVDWAVDKKAKQIRDAANAAGKEVAPEKRYKVLEVSDLALYWDDGPPLLLSECPILKYSNQLLTPHKVLTIIRTAMLKMKYHQDPGEVVRGLLESGESSGSKRTAERSKPSKDHVYVLKETSMEMRLALTLDGDGSTCICSAEVVPCHFDLSFRPHQLRQRRLLEYTMIGQGRLNTMLHQRPTRRPTEVPRAWWRYVISCVVTRQNSRPWRDVKTIIAKRAEYVALVEKKHLRRGLEDQESAILLHLEDVLPIETLLAFHLIALRNVLEKRERMQQRSPTRQRGQRKPKGDQEEDLYSIMDSESVVSNRSPRRGTPGRRRSRSREPYIAMVAHDENSPTKPILPRSPGPKLPTIARKGGMNSPWKERGGVYSPPKARVLDDNMSQAQSVASQGTMNLEFSNAQNHDFDFGDMVPDDDEEVDFEESPPMIKMIRGHSISISATLLDRHNGNPVLKGSVQASLWAKSSLMEGTTILFDIQNIDCIDCIERESSKIMTFNEPAIAIESDSTSGDNAKISDDASELTIPNELRSFDEDNFLDSFCSQMIDEDMPLPPRGVVCRLLISFNALGRSVNLSAHAATLVWNTRCIRAFMDSFFPSQSQEDRSILRTQLRNAATPLAHRAQIALTSPRAMSIKINIDAPKIWFPVSQAASDGALFIDSGRLNMTLRKPQLLANMHWSINSTGMYANFRQANGDVFASSRNIPSSPDDISILSPFNFSVEVDRCGEGPAFLKRKDGVEYELSRHMHMKFSAITVNLVDVEVLALAIGRWYAAELLSVQRRSEQTEQKEALVPNNGATGRINPVDNISEEEITVSVESIELYLQGKAKPQRGKGRKRTYMVQVAEIGAKRCSRGDSRTTDIEVGDVNITQGRSGANRHFKASNELRHKFLTCSAVSEGGQKGGKRAKASSTEGRKSALKVTLLQDNKHSNDFDVQFGHVVLRLTPTMLTDCSIAIGRIAESTKIMTREMERRVHLTSRSTRIRITESRGKNGL